MVSSLTDGRDEGERGGARELPTGGSSGARAPHALSGPAPRSLTSDPLSPPHRHSCAGVWIPQLWVREYAGHSVVPGYQYEQVLRDMHINYVPFTGALRVAACWRPLA